MAYVKVNYNFIINDETIRHLGIKCKSADVKMYFVQEKMILKRIYPSNLIASRRIDFPERKEKKGNPL